ncbi:MAG: hypothetical protein JKX94_06720, partial [Sneathiella sp.]|nr:hypothetical protein [Sneathiella sp.]
IWSAGCSSGEEPYSITSVILGKMASMSHWDIRILATDLDTNMLQKGRAGIYEKSSIEKIPDTYKQAFSEITTLKKDVFHIKQKAKNLVSFNQLNLLHKWPMKRKFDAIFCRNVLIYFDGPTKETLVRRYSDMLMPGGLLFLGHSESLAIPTPGLSLIGRTSYIKES